MSINRNKTLEDRIRSLERKAKKMQEILNEFREMNRRFDGLENKLGRTFKVVARGFDDAGHSSYSNEIDEIWKESVKK